MTAGAGAARACDRGVAPRIRFLHAKAGHRLAFATEGEGPALALPRTAGYAMELRGGRYAPAHRYGTLPHPEPQERGERADGRLHEHVPVHAARNEKIPYLLHSAAAGSAHLAALRSRGAGAVPYFFDPNTGEAAASATEIAVYLEATYGIASAAQAG